MKLSNDALKLLQGLPQEQRKKAEAIINRYCKACEKQGVPIDSVDRVVIESVEAVRLEDENYYLEETGWPTYSPFRRYDVYTSPADLKI
jgi:hypothetical protein